LNGHCTGTSPASAASTRSPAACSSITPARERGLPRTQLVAAFRGALGHRVDASRRLATGPAPDKVEDAPRHARGVRQHLERDVVAAGEGARRIGVQRAEGERVSRAHAVERIRVPPAGDDEERQAREDGRERAEGCRPLARASIDVVRHQQRGPRRRADPGQRRRHVGGAVAAGRIPHHPAVAMHLARELGREPRLAHPGGADHGDEAPRTGPRRVPVRAEPAERGVAPHERRLRGGVQLRRQVGRGRLELERRVLGQDRVLEAPQLRPGLDARLLDEHVAGAAVDLERLRLAAAAIQRQHELRRQPFARRVGGQQTPELAHDLQVPPGGEMGLGPRLQRRQALLLEPRDLRLGERLERQLRQRRPTPQRERLVQDDDRTRRLVSRHRAACRRHAALEALGVELVGAHAEPVARRSRGDRVRVAEHLAQPRHVDPDRLRRAGRRVLAPQRQREAVGAHRLVRMQEQHREHRARPDAAQRHDTGRVGHLERSEDPEVHRPGRVRYRRRLCAISLAAHLRVPWSSPGTRARRDARAGVRHGCTACTRGVTDRLPSHTREARRRTRRRQQRALPA
jgi:hypothetical protein